MKRLFSINIVAILLSSVFVACGGSSPNGEAEQDPAAEVAPSSAGEPEIFEEDFEAGDNQEWSDSEVASENEDSEPEVPEQD